MLPIPRKTRPPKDPKAEMLYPESDALKLPLAVVEVPHPKKQKEITFALTRAHRKSGYPRLSAPTGVTQVPLFFIDRAKDICAKLKSHHNRHQKTKHYYDSCAHYDPLDPDLLYNQAVYHSQFNEYDKALEKVQQCLKINARDHRALLLKADTYFRICDFETALLFYSQGVSLKFPYNNCFLDGYYRTTALLYDLTTGDLPMFYGGNMKVFHRLVQGQERSQRIFNDTYKHYGELFPLQPNLTGVQEEINVFHVTKAEPANHIQQRIRTAAMQQLTSAQKSLGNFYDCKIEIEKDLIKRRHFLPRFGRANQSQRIERALRYLRARIDKFEVICALMKSRQMRAQYDRPVDWMLKYGKWMADRKMESSVPPAPTRGLLNSRYQWALSQTLFDIRAKPLHTCWVRTLRPKTPSLHLLAKRRSWKSLCADKSAGRAAVATLRFAGQDWPFMQKLQTTVWNQLQQQAPPPDAFLRLEHIGEIEPQMKEYGRTEDNLAKASKLTMPMMESPDKSKLYYDPETNQRQWDDNRDLVKAALLKRRRVPSLLPLRTENRPLPANLLEVFESKASEDATAWDQRRKMSMELRETLAKAEAVRATQIAQEKNGLFGAAKTPKKDVAVKAKMKGNSDVDVRSSSELAVGPGVIVEISAEGAEKFGTLPADCPVSEDEDLGQAKSERKVRRPGERPRCDILNKKPDHEYQDKPCVKRRIPKDLMTDDRSLVETVEELGKTSKELEAESVSSVRVDEPVQIARRIFDNQKAALLERSYAVLMTCTKISEFLEIQLEIGDLLDTTFPPKNMRFPDGEPILLTGYPAPAVEYRRLIPSEIFANRKKRKDKFGGTEDEKAATAEEAAQEANTAQQLMAGKSRRRSLPVAASNPVLDANEPAAPSATFMEGPVEN